MKVQTHGLLIFLLMMGTKSLCAQSPQATLKFSDNKSWPDPTSPFTTKYLFPQHILQNPMGHAPLCRMELKLERQLPVGVWMRLDGNSNTSLANPGLAYVRFKLPLAGR